MIEKLYSIGFRGAGVSGRFFLIFLLTKKISLAFQGEFTLVSTSVAILMLMVGLDIYAFSNQRIVQKPEDSAWIFKNSLHIFSRTYLLLIPIGLGLYFFMGLDWTTALLFVVLTIGEHLAQEMFRNYVAIQKVVFANILFFVRAGLWSWLIVLYLFFTENAEITINQILICWAVCSYLSLLLGLLYLPGIKQFREIQIDKEWTRKALAFAKPMIVSTLLLKGIEYVDRYMIDLFMDRTQVGVYAFYFQLANLVNLIIFTLYVSFIYPKIFKNVQDKNLQGFRDNSRELYRASLFLVIGFAVFYALIINPMVDLMDKPELANQYPLLILLLCSTLFFNLSYSSHYFLIAGNKEKTILRITAWICGLTIVLNLVLIPFLGVIGPAIVLNVAGLMMWMFKRKQEKEMTKLWEE